MSDDLCFKTRERVEGSGRSNHSGQFRSPPCHSPPRSSLQDPGQITANNDDWVKGLETSK